MQAHLSPLHTIRVAYTGYNVYRVLLLWTLLVRAVYTVTRKLQPYNYAGRCTKYCDMSVCPLAYLENHMAELDQFLCTLPMAVARSFSGGVAIRCVLPVLLMTSHFHLMALWR